MSNSSTFKVLTLYTMGFFLRFIILKSPLSESLANRVEISTPLSSWQRAVEGVSLWKQDTNPYDSDIFHESPLALLTYSYILTYAKEWLPVIFAACDLLTPVLLALAARIYLKSSVKKDGALVVPESSKLLTLKFADVESVPFYVAAVYLLCPYSVMSCGAKSTVTFQNLVLALYIFLMVADRWLLASLVLAVLSCHSLYHVVLLVPLTMRAYQNGFGGPTLVTLSFFAAVAALLSSFRSFTGSWEFAWNIYGCILSVPDLTPNIGLFWYFFTEMFEHFRVFFICIFQLNVFIYTLPLAVRFRGDTVFLTLVLVLIVALFKSYPCLGDVALCFALLPAWAHLFPFMRHRFIVCCVLASCTLLAPTLWHLWIYSGSANANFYFAITLAFNTGQVFLLTDLLSGYLKREYYLEKGLDGAGKLLIRLQ